MLLIITLPSMVNSLTVSTPVGIIHHRTGGINCERKMSNKRKHCINKKSYNENKAKHHAQL